MQYDLLSLMGANHRKQEAELKLVLENGTVIELDYAGSNPNGDMLHLGYDTDHPDLLSVTINLPQSDADRICTDLGLTVAGVAA